MSDHIEIEQKFDVEESFERPDFGSLPGDITAAPPVTFQLSATYFDTSDERLAARKITLRRRTGGTDEGWHLKLPAGEGARRELQEPLSAGEEAVDGTGPHQVPARFAVLVAEVTGGLALAPVAALHTERTVVTLTGHDGRVVAEIADDEVTARRLSGTSGGAGAASEPLRWREIEVEVPVAAPALQRAAADLLLSAGARPAGHGSKLARVLGRLARPAAAGPSG